MRNVIERKESKNLKLVIYGHGGAENHGNEAIVRGVRNLFPNAELIVYSFSPDADRHFGLDEICEIRGMTQPSIRQTSILFFIARILKRLFPKNRAVKWFYYWRFFSPFLKELDSEKIYILEAGDQYCEKSEHRWFYSYLNKKINKIGAKTVMLGCTINPEILDDKSVMRDINAYSSVIARESITYNALMEKGASTEFYLAPCPAFSMPAMLADLPEWITHKEFVGINVGFLAQGNEKYYEILMRNMENCIQRIIEQTTLDIALIPHVNWCYTATDFTALDVLYKKFKSTGRVHYIEEHNASQQKYIIAKCKAFVALRTHAAVSGLESHVPTLIAGYKTKSKGISNDIFGEEFDMLADVQSLVEDNIIADKLFGILNNEVAIREYYAEHMSVYLDGLNTIVDVITELSE